MNPNTPLAHFIFRPKTSLILVVGLPALLIALPLICAEPRNGGVARGGGGPAPRAVVVDRSSHGSVRHADTQVVQRPAVVRSEPVRPAVVRSEPARSEPARPVVVRPEPAHPAEVHPEAGHPAEVRRDVAPRRDFVVHRDVEADVHRQRFWNDFAFHRHFSALPTGYLALQIGGTPYYYDDGIYYQPDNGGYQEVYPPVGAGVPEPPDGAIEVDAGGQVYYYAGGAFYLQQPDGTYAIAPTPIGVVFPELPPGAVQVSVNGTVAYQFNGIYYEPVFVNGVTQYETFTP